MRRTSWRAIRSLRPASVSDVVPRGTGTPSARKLVDLPMCASATSSVLESVISAAFCGSRASVRPATAIVTIARQPG